MSDMFKYDPEHRSFQLSLWFRDNSLHEIDYMQTEKCILCNNSEAC